MGQTEYDKNSLECNVLPVTGLSWSQVKQTKKILYLETKRRDAVYMKLFFNMYFLHGKSYTFC